MEEWIKIKLIGFKEMVFLMLRYNLFKALTLGYFLVLPMDNTEILGFMLEMHLWGLID